MIQLETPITVWLDGKVIDVLAPGPTILLFSASACRPTGPSIKEHLDQQEPVLGTADRTVTQPKEITLP